MLRNNMNVVGATFEFKLQNFAKGKIRIKVRIDHVLKLEKVIRNLTIIQHYS
jgi:hypothetical protein